VNIVDPSGGRNSVYPPTEGLTFFPFIYMVPQYRPDDVLLLGYAGGTVAGLIKLLYGAVPITAVDVNLPFEDYYDVRFIQADARRFVRDCRKFDAVVVDVFADGEQVPCPFVTDPQFAADVTARARYVIVHAKASTDMAVWGRPLKVLALNDSRFYYFMVERVGRLPIR